MTQIENPWQVGSEVGRPMPRVEDERLVRGQGRFTDDIHVAGAASMVVVRSMTAAARLVKVDVDAAAKSTGVLGVFTGVDAAADNLGVFSNRERRALPDGTPMFEPPRRVLARDSIRHVGDPIAVVVAESLNAAKDAAELVDITDESLPAVTCAKEALLSDAPCLWKEAPGNVAFVYEVGQHADAMAAFKSAAHITSLEFRVSRVSASPLEPRAAIGIYDDSSGMYTLYVSTQTPHSLRNEIARNILRISPNQLRVIAPDVGGAFGMKGSDYAEYGLLLWCARKFRRPVRWTSDRSESFLADHHGRDSHWQVALALDEKGRFLALKADVAANLGAYLAYAGTHQATNNLGGLAGVYTTPHLYAKVTGVFTNTSPVAPYRGAGRPEATFAIERVIDLAAAELGIDRIELRRRNLIPPEAMPYQTGLVFRYDCGDFPRLLDRAIEASEWSSFAERRRHAAERGCLRGIGLAFAIEIAGGPAKRPYEEFAALRLDSAGTAYLLLGTHSQGQGHETAFRQITAELLGLPMESIRLLFGDTEIVPHGRGTFGSRSMSSGGAALSCAADKLIAKGRQIAAVLLDVASSDVDFCNGFFGVTGSNRKVSWADVAEAAYRPELLPLNLEPGLVEQATAVAAGPTFPNSVHVCEVEVDPDTGACKVVTYLVADDCGRIINPLIAEGQIHGGVAQALGQAMSETIQYDESGQLITGSFLDYALPRASDCPPIAVVSHGVPTAANPLGVKGIGEAGTVGGIAAINSAIVDALRDYGIRDLDMPATAHTVWQAIRNADNNTMPES